MRVTTLLMTVALAFGSLLLVAPAQAQVGVDDYPANLKNRAQDAIADPWNFYNRECTSFVAWRLNNDAQVAFHNYYLGRHWGNASNWAAAARQTGVPVDDQPSVGAVAWWAAGSRGSWSGHVAWVSAVSDTSLTIEEYNYVHRGGYSTRVISSSSPIWPTGFIHVTPAKLAATTAPTVVGTAQVGSRLTADPGTWTPSGASFAYRWYADGVRIAGAESRRFTPEADQLDAQLSVRVTATAPGVDAAKATSAPTSGVLPGVLVATGAPELVGEAQVGKPLQATPGSWSKDAEVTYQWYAAGDPLPGATQPVYTPTADQLHRRLRVEATAARAGYTPATVRSVRTARTVPGTLTVSAPPRISGTTRIGSTLTLDPGLWTPAGTHTVQWLVAGKPVDGATGSTFTPTRPQLGHRLSARVTTTEPGYDDAVVTTQVTTIVRRGILQQTTPATVLGQAQVGTVLTADPGAWSPQPRLAYQWLADGVTLPGATAPTLTVAPEQLGRSLSVQVSATRVSYLTALSTTAATAPVAPGRIEAVAQPTVPARPRVGVALEASAGVWSVPGAQVGYQWRAQGHPITGADQARFVPTRTEVGHDLSLRVRVSAPGYETTTVELPSGQVLRGDTALASGPRITGDATVGHRLTARTGAPTPLRAEVAYRWFRGSEPIHGARADRYRLRSADEGQRISVRVRLTRTDWATTSYLSEATDRVEGSAR